MLSPRVKSYVPESVKKSLRYSRQVFETMFPWNIRLLLHGTGVKLHRRCVVLGSSPDPHPPRFGDFDLVCVNGSGFVAREIGLPEPKLTVLGGFKLVHPKREEDRRILRGLRTEYLLLIRHLLPICSSETEHLLERWDYRYEQLLTVDFWDRACMIRNVTGKRLGGEDTPNASRQGTWNMVSNGIFAACYALYNGAPEIILSGFSLTMDGHYYSNQNRPRRHVPFDLAALTAMQERGQPVKTTEPELAGLTGLPLV